MRIDSDGNIWLHWKDLMSYGYTHNTLNVGTTRYRAGASTSYENKPDPENGQLNLIKYDSIPNREEKLPTKQELISGYQSDRLAGMVIEDPLALSYYADYGLDNARVAQYTEQAAWMMLSAPMNRSQARLLGYNSVDDFYNDVIKYTNKHEILVIANLASFKRKLKPFNQLAKAEPNLFNPDSKEYFLKQDTRSELYEAALNHLISKKLGKRNAAKLVINEDAPRTKYQAQLCQDYIIEKAAEGIKTGGKMSETQVYGQYMGRATREFSKWKTAVDLWAKDQDETTRQIIAAFWKNQSGDHISEVTGLAVKDIRPVLYHIREEIKTGWNDKCLFTLETIQNLLKRTEVQKEIYPLRHGKKEAHNKHSRIITRRPASFANAKWVIDGTPWHRYYVHDGYTYHRLNVFVVLDAHSWAVIGFYVSKSENVDQVIGALRAACMITGFIPYELQSDNSSAIKSYRSQYAINQLAKWNIPARVGNARAKMIEPFFAHFNEHVGKFREGYSGNPFAKDINRRPNLDMLHQLRKTGGLSTERDVIRELKEDFNTWNNHLFNGAKPIEKYKQSTDETAHLQRKFNEAIDREAFWYIPGEAKKIKETGQKLFVPKEVRFDGDGLKFKREEDEKPTVFDLPSGELSDRYMGERFTMRVHPDNYNEEGRSENRIAYLYQNNKLVMHNGAPLVAVPKKTFANALVDRLPNEGTEWAEEMQFEEDRKRAANNRYQERIERLKKANLLGDPVTAQTVEEGKERATLAKNRMYEGLLEGPQEAEGKSIYDLKE